MMKKRKTTCRHLKAKLHVTDDKNKLQRQTLGRKRKKGRKEEGKGKEREEEGGKERKGSLPNEQQSN